MLARGVLYRRRQVLRLVAQRGTARAADVAGPFGFGEDWGRQRLDELADQGYVAGDPAQITDAGQAELERLDQASPDGRRRRREEKVIAALVLRQEHPHWSNADIAREIARRFGGTCTANTVKSYFNDRDGTKAKRRRTALRGQCEVCGIATRGDRHGKIPARCQKHRANERRTAFDQAGIVEVLRTWNDEFGSWPTSTALRKDVAQRKGGAALERWERFGLHHVQVIREFGSFHAALDAAMDPQFAADDAPTHQTA